MAYMSDSQRINFAFVGEPPPEWAAYMDKSAKVLRVVDDQSTDWPQSSRRGASRRVMPEFRTAPNPEDPFLAELEQTFSFQFDPEGSITLEIVRVRIYPAGIAFRLVGIDRTRLELADDGRCLNLGSRKKSGGHRVRLVVDLPDGTILSNSDAPQDYPDDPTSPWLAGGTSYSRRVSGGIESGAEYYLSPIPPPGEMIVTVAYPEFMIPMTSMTLDTRLFSHAK